MSPNDRSPPPPSPPITEADLHGYVDGQLSAERRDEVERYLDERADERARVAAWQRDAEALRRLFDPVLSEPVPLQLRVRRAPPAPWRALAAAVAFAALSAAAAWTVRGAIDRQGAAGPIAGAAASADRGASSPALSGFAHRAAVAHAVYSPEVRRPVEVGADQEQQLVTWLSKRLGTPVKAPALKPIGYELVGGRLLPGEAGPVAQFMYQDGAGQRLTLYVTREPPKGEDGAQVAFKFGRDGPVNVFYWVDKDFGYALSGSADRQELTRIAHEVYRQLGGR